MRILIVVIGVLFQASVAFGQGAVMLSSLKVTDVIDASKHEINRFFVELQVSDPSSLGRLEVNLTDHHNATNNFISSFSVVIKDDKVSLDMGKYAVPFEGQTIRFFVPVIDQIKNTYNAVEVTGYDKQGGKTMSLVFNRRN